MTVKPNSMEGAWCNNMLILGPFFRVPRITAGGRRAEYACVCQCRCGKVCVKRSVHFPNPNRAKACCNSCPMKRGWAISDTQRKLRALYRSMLFRCHNPNCNNYHDYGGRGISVCQEWRDSRNAFLDWAMHHGWELGKEIDRVDNDGDYSPDNCRFVNRKENANNKRNNLQVQYLGETKTVAEWSEDSRIKVSRKTIYARLSKGWSAVDALTKPARRW